MSGLLQALKGAFWPPQSNGEPQERVDRSIRRETTTLNGRVTQYDKATGSGMIDHRVYFDGEVIVGGGRPQIGSEVSVSAEREHALAGWKATKVVIASQWKSSVPTVVVNKVGYILEEGRSSCLVLCGEEEFVFRREVVTQGYYPHRGDWVVLNIAEEDEEDPVINGVKCLREKTVSATVESYSGRLGMIEGDIGFSLGVCESGYTPREGDVVTVHCVECNHARMAWRALKVLPNRNRAMLESSVGIELPSSTCVTSDVRCGVVVSGEGDFGEVESDKVKKLVMLISNNCSSTHALLSCAPLTLKDQLKVTIGTELHHSQGEERAESKEEEECTKPDEHICTVTLPPGSSIEVSLELNSNVLGKLATAVVFDFGDFRISRSVRARVVDEGVYLIQPSQPYMKNSHKRTAYNQTQYWDKLWACTVPGQKPIRKQMLRLPHKLKAYPIPDDIRDCIELEEDVTFVRPSLMEPLSSQSHQEHFSTLMFCEELQMEKNIRMFDMFSVSLVPYRQYMSLNVPGLSEGRPSVIVGDRVVICEPGGDERSEHHEGYIHEVRGDDVLLMFSENFHSRYHGNESYDIMFTFGRTPLRRMHQAIEMGTQIGNKVLFPISPSPHPPLLRSSPSLNTLFNPCLNDRQQAAVARVLGAQGRPSPYIIFGPPGTGKTVTLVEAILQVYVQSRGSERILACAPSNSAADLIAERLLDSGKLEKGVLVRVNALQRVQPPSPELLPHCVDTAEIETAIRHKIIVSTCVTAGMFYSLGLPIGHFTRVFVDEAGQATEPECLIPVGLLTGTDGQPVLAGDPFQLGPVLQSRLAQTHGLGVSLLERLMNRPAYQRNQEKFVDHGAYDPLLVTKLVINYRSHPSLLSLYSKIFYDGELEPAADPTMSHSLCQWRHLPNLGFPLLFHGIVGEDLREGDSPSWFNPMEVVQVVRYAQLLLDGSLPLTIEDIGIITPYRKQVEKIRMFLKVTGLEDVKVGSVEEFQGQERLAIILSTVRCSSDLLQVDVQHNLGFLSNPKRFNVSISRAQALLIVVGNPSLLNQDPHWSQLLMYAIENSVYVGAPLNSSSESLSAAD